MDKKEQLLTTTKPPSNNNNFVEDKNCISKQELNGHKNEMIRKDIENLPKDESRKLVMNNCNHPISQNNHEETSNSNHIFPIGDQQSAQMFRSSTIQQQQNNIVDQLILPENNLQIIPPLQSIEQQQLSLSSPTNSNSTDNLSYSSDNNYIEELLLLQSTLTDEDDDNCQSINSDDCIYAYRGGAGDLDQLEQNHNSRISNVEEDETDFLEMDFDPDPPSEEQQNPVEVYQQREFEKEILLNEQRLNIQNDILLNDITNNIQQQQHTIPPNNISSAVISSSIIDDNNIPMIVKNHNSQHQQSNDNDKINKIPNELTNMKKTNNENQYKITGTKPKKLMDNKYINGGGNTILNNSNCNTSGTTINKLRKQQQKSYDLDKKNYHHQNSIIDSSSNNDKQQQKNYNKLNSIKIAAGDSNKESGDDIICLDCLEKEFLEKTVGKIIDNNIECLKCKLKRNPFMYGSEGMGDSTVNNIHNHQQQHQQELQQQQQHLKQTKSKQLQNEQHQNTNNHHHHKSSLSFDFINDLLTTKEFNNAIQRRASCDNINENEMLLRMTNKDSSTFSSINVDSAVLVQALEKINFFYDEQILNKYFIENTRENFIDVGDFILYSSKKNCNYKKIIKLIKLATKDQLIIKFNFDEKSSSFEVVQVKVYDIIQCWLHNNDLTNLKKLNKRFFEMNILGKIINLIRQAQQRTTKQPLKEYILIPQYYKSGFITITKKN